MSSCARSRTPGATGIGMLIAIAVFIGAASPHLQAMDAREELERMLKSAYTLPYNKDQQLTDVVLMNAQVTDTRKVERVCDQIIRAFNSNPAPQSRPRALRREIDRMTLTPDNSNIHLFRERTFRQMYRLDTSWQPATFAELKWMDGQFTNIFPAYKAAISVNPSSAGGYWTNYTVMPFHDHVVVDTGEKCLVQRYCQILWMRAGERRAHPDGLVSLRDLLLS